MFGVRWQVSNSIYLSESKSKKSQDVDSFDVRRTRDGEKDLAEAGLEDHALVSTLSIGSVVGR